MVFTEHLSVSTRGHTDIIDITSDCQQIVKNTGLSNGIVTVFNPGSTGSLTTIEFESNLVEDFQEALDNLASYDRSYKHEKTWHDDNGAAHVRASLMGPSISVPFTGGELTLGTWQQIVFCDFDTRPRDRRLIIQVIGE